MKLIDLHTHSKYSDGSMTPSELVRHAYENGLSAIALSDHDSVDGVKEAMSEGKRLGIEVVPGIEFSAQSETETHILGYFIDIDSKELQEKLEISNQVRYQREVETMELLRKAGFDVTMEEADELAGNGVLCRAHFAKLMVKKGYVSSVREAFDKYLNSGKVAHSKKQAFTDTEIINIINNAGGMAFCAHLHLTRKPLGELERFLLRLKESGLSGVEGYYTDYTPEMQLQYQTLAERMGLLISGGTDFHGQFKPHISIGKGLGSLEIPYSVLEKMKQAKSKP